MAGANQRFAEWVEWLGKPSQASVAERIGCSQAMVSKILAGSPVRNLPLATRIESATAEWPGGPIRVGEWSESATGDHEPERAAS